MNWFTVGKALDPIDLFGIRGSENTKRSNDAVDKAQAQADQASAANKALYGQYSDRINNEYGDTAAKFDSYLQNIENQEVYNPGNFEYDKSVNDFFDKYYNQSVKAANNAMENGAANNGSLFSSDTLNKIQAKNRAMSTEAWTNALNAYNADRQRALTEFSTNANIQNQAYQNEFNKNNALLGIAQGAKDNVNNAYGTYVNNMASQNNSDATNAANLAMAKAQNANSNNISLISRIFG